MHRLVSALEKARSQRGRKAKVSAIADALRAVADDGEDEELATAARLVAGEILPARDEAVLGVGFALVMSAAAEAFGLVARDLQTRARSLGDLGDAVRELAAPHEGTSERPGLRLRDVLTLARTLAATTDRGAKTEALRAAYDRARPDQAKYLTKVLLGELRVGVREGTLEEAIAEAFGRDPQAVREAAIFCTDPGDLAVLARHDELDRATFVLGTRLAFMLASPIEVVKAPLDLARTVWEDKLDGVRVQAHASPGRVRLFARGGGEVSAAFPEVARALAGVDRDLVLDGELLAVTPEGKPRPFQALQARLNRREPDARLLAETPVALFAFDLLCDVEPILSLPWEERRARMEAVFAAGAFAPVAQATVVHALDPLSPEGPQVDEAYAAARSRGHEGIVLKDRASPYEAGRRGSAWRKVKRALATLDVVITRAERGHGKRAAVLSDYTFAVWDGAALVEIGKAYSGLTDVEIAELTKELEARTIDTKGTQRLVLPTIVLEVAFDGLQPSTRHASGLALRFPRIVRVRPDKKPEEADTLTTARALFDAQVASGHRENAAPARMDETKPKNARGPKTARKPQGRNPRQLVLFGLDNE